MNFIWKQIVKVYRYLLSTHQWSLMYKPVSNGEYIDIEQPKNLARADGFLVECDGKLYVFFEEFELGNDHIGYLMVGELDTVSHQIINTHKLLEKTHHLSYPFVFQYKGGWFLIPETGANLTIDLYKFSTFPNELIKVKTLIDNIDAVDTTITVMDDTVYLFTNVKDGGSHSNNLSLFYSDDLLKGQFVAHPRNPLSSDSQFSRMAGGIMKMDNRLYRVAQDCSITYGHCVHKFEILELSKQNYKERLVETLKPPKGYGASHTFNSSKNYELIDVKRNEVSVVNIVKNLYYLSRVVLRKALFR